MTRSVEELNAFAERPFEFEVGMMLTHAWLFLERYPDGMVGAGLRSNDDDALLEAWLVHIRLLDDFLKDNRKRDAAAAADWKPKLRATPFLKRADREVVNDQLMHLSWTRKRWVVGGDRPPWDGQIRPWSNACCEHLIAFFDAVRDELASAFAKPREHAERWLESGARPIR